MLFPTCMNYKPVERANWPKTDTVKPLLMDTSQ
jgi:hypothetical protein